MGIFDQLRGIRDRRNDPDCPLNVARAKARAIYGPIPMSSLVMNVMITRNPNHPVCRKCTRRDWFNCGVETPPTPKSEAEPTEKKKEKSEEVALKGLKTLFE